MTKGTVSGKSGASWPGSKPGKSGNRYSCKQHGCFRKARNLSWARGYCFRHAAEDGLKAPEAKKTADWYDEVTTTSQENLADRSVITLPCEDRAIVLPHRSPYIPFTTLSSDMCGPLCEQLRHAVIVGARRRGVQTTGDGDEGVLEETAAVAVAAVAAAEVIADEAVTVMSAEQVIDDAGLAIDDAGLAVARFATLPRGEMMHGVANGTLVATLTRRELMRLVPLLMVHCDDAQVLAAIDQATQEQLLIYNYITYN